MSDTKSASAMFEILGKAMDEVAREFRAVGPKRPETRTSARGAFRVDTAQTLAEVRAQ
jgi:hypothetical protein